MIELVNGYPCFDCTDAERAKKNVDPAMGRNERAAADQKADDTRANEAHARDNAVILDGVLAKANVQDTEDSSAAAKRADEARAQSRLDITV